MDSKDLHNKSKADLEKLLSQARADLYDLRMKTAINQLKDIRSIRATRKDIARILTQLRQTNS